MRVKELVDEVRYKRDKKDEGSTTIEEFKPLWNGRDSIVKRHPSYLYKRGINDKDILKYNIGYCDDGLYSNRILPSYDSDGQLNFLLEETSTIVN